MNLANGWIATGGGRQQRFKLKFNLVQRSNRRLGKRRVNGAVNETVEHCPRRDEALPQCNQLIVEITQFNRRPQNILLACGPGSVLCLSYVLKL